MVGARAKKDCDGHLNLRIVAPILEEKNGEKNGSIEG